MKLNLTTVLFLAFALCALSQCFATAIARASGHVGDGGPKLTEDIKDTEADAKRNNFAEEFAEDKFSAKASVKGGILKAEAFANLVTATNSVSAAAEATWVDILEVSNPHLVTAGCYLFFRPRAHGYLNHGTTASFYVAIANPLDGIILEEQYFEGHTGANAFEAEIKLTAFDFFAPKSFYMSLQVNAAVSSQPDIAEAGFYETAYLPPIFIGDAQGNPIPELAGLLISGESGLSYPTTVVQRTPGDFNGNGIVDAADYVVWRRSVGQTGLTQNADGNGDRIVDDEDFKVWRENFGNIANLGAGLGQATNVPEPATCTLTACGLVPLLLRGRRRRPA